MNHSLPLPPEFPLPSDRLLPTDHSLPPHLIALLVSRVADGTLIITASPGAVPDLAVNPALTWEQET